MTTWFRMYAEVLDDPKVQRLPPEAFKAAFLQATRGEGGLFARFVKKDRGRPVSAAWRALRAEVFQRDDFTCTYCGARGSRLECDHIIPVAKGGADDLRNLTTACFRCNRSKRDKLLSEWRPA